jgi:hypothetical protein
VTIAGGLRRSYLIKGTYLSTKDLEMPSRPSILIIIGHDFEFEQSCDRSYAARAVRTIGLRRRMSVLMREEERPYLVIVRDQVVA